MLVPVGQSTISTTTDRATIGRFSGDLVNGRLLLQITTQAPAEMQSLAFGIVSFIDNDTGVRVLGDARYYPKAEPTVIALGHGDRSTVDGVVILEPRAFNLRWLEREQIGNYWQVAVEADTTAGTSVPAYTPTAFIEGQTTLSASVVTGADGESYGQVNWHE